MDFALVLGLVLVGSALGALVVLAVLADRPTISNLEGNEFLDYPSEDGGRH